MSNESMRGGEVMLVGEIIAVLYTRFMGPCSRYHPPPSRELSGVETLRNINGTGLYLLFMTKNYSTANSLIANMMYHLGML